MDTHPLQPRRVAQTLWEHSAIDCLSSATSHVFVACQDEFRLPHMKVSNAGSKRMWGSLFFGFFLLAKQKKETRQSGETGNPIKANV